MQATAGERWAPAAAQLPPPLHTLRRPTNRALLFLVLQHNVGPFLQALPQQRSKPGPFFPPFKIFSSTCFMLHWRWTVCPLQGQRAMCSLLPLPHTTLHPNPNPEVRLSLRIVRHPSLQRHSMGREILSLVPGLRVSIQNTYLRMPWDRAHVCYDGGTFVSILAPSSPPNSNIGW